MTDESASNPRDDSITIERARSLDLTEILNLLTQSGLPQDGVSDHIASALVARSNQAVVGCAALELYGQAALLRSVAVAKKFKGKGLGKQLTREILNLGKEKGVSHFYLLTETAGEYFPKFGFQPIDRSKVPYLVQNSVEFTSACPASALAMTLEVVSKPQIRFKGKAQVNEKAEHTQ
jgi:amino-acid N-acetyltransferase